MPGPAAVEVGRAGRRDRARRRRGGCDGRLARGDARPLVDVLVAVGRIEDAAGEQAVHERPGAVAARRVHDEPGRLVQHDDGVVDVDDVELDARPRRAPRSRGGGSGSTAMRAPSRSFSAAFLTTPSTVTPPCSIQRWSSERDGPSSIAESVDARKRSRRAPAASRGTTRRMVRTLGPRTRGARRYQIFDLMWPLALIRMSTSARS